MGQSASQLLIVIPTKSGQEYIDRITACKQTWLADATQHGVNWKTFSDVELNLDSSRREVRQVRTQLMVRYALQHNYQHVLRIDSDAFLHIPRFLDSGFEQWDYSGHSPDPKDVTYPDRVFAHGGSGFILSRLSMELISVAQPCPTQPDLPDAEWFGDMWVSKVLYRHGIKCHRDERYIPDNGYERRHLPNWVSLHPLTPEEILSVHKEAA